MNRRPKTLTAWACTLVLLASLSTWTREVAAQGGGYSEQAVAAVLLERIVSFLRWPDSVPTERPYRIVVLGQAKVGEQLERIFRGRLFGGRPMSLRYAARASDLGDADIVFIGHQLLEPLSQVLAAANREGVLTVADTPGYAAQGVAINFYREGARVRFEIRPSALKRAKIKASYKLLTLARIVGQP